MWSEQVVYRTISTYNYIQVTTKDKKIKRSWIRKKKGETYGRVWGKEREERIAIIVWWSQKSKRDSKDK